MEKTHHEPAWDPSVMKEYDGMLLACLDYPLEYENGNPSRWDVSVLLGNKHAKRLMKGAPAILGAADFYRTMVSVADRDVYTKPGKDAFGRDAEDSYSHDEILCNLSGHYDEDTIDMIQNGRIKMIMLLRSKGGLGEILRSCASAARYFERNDGAISTIAMEYNASASAMLSWVPGKEERIITTDAKHMFHRSDNGARSLLSFLPPEMQSMCAVSIIHGGDADDFLKVFDYQRLQAGIGDREMENIYKKIQNARELSHETRTVFDEHELRSLGLCKSTLPFSEIHRHVRQETGFSTDASEPHLFNPVSRFVQLAEIQHTTRRRFGLASDEIVLQWEPVRDEKGVHFEYGMEYGLNGDVPQRSAEAWQACIPQLQPVFGGQEYDI